MPELADPWTAVRRSMARLTVIEHLEVQIARLQSEQRQQLAAWWSDDTRSGDRTYLSDELSLALQISPGSAQHRLEEAALYLQFPAVMARVGLPIADGGWSLKHADALLEAICGLGLTPAMQQQVIDMVTAADDARTPYQVRKAADAAVMVLDPDAAARRFERAKKDRWVGSDTLGSGRAQFSAIGTASHIAMVMASLDALAGPKQPGDDRTLDQRRFDAFMDLICGRIQPGHWQALIVTTLATLEGTSEEPAEIPGLGLIAAQEAREALAHAELRRAVVDEDGALISVDSTVRRPDGSPVDDTDPARQVSHDPEPDPLDTSPEHRPDPADQTWHHTQLLTDELAVDLSGDEWQITLACSDLERELHALLTEHALVGAGTVHTVTRGSGSLPVEIDHGGHHQPPPDDPPPDEPRDGPPHKDPPPDDPPPDDTSTEPSGDNAAVDGPVDAAVTDEEPEPPSFADRAWAESACDWDGRDPTEPRPRYQREPPDPRPSRPVPRSSSWTFAGLVAAHRRLRTAPVDRRPLTCEAYALSPRLARFIKTRDITCVFPGCRRLARDCQNDHVIPWPKGPSSVSNTTSDCTHHHQAKGAYFKVTLLPDGSVRWATPLGRSYTRAPRPLLRGW